MALFPKVGIAAQLDAATKGITPKPEVPGPSTASTPTADAPKKPWGDPAVGTGAAWARPGATEPVPQAAGMPPDTAAFITRAKTTSEAPEPKGLTPAKLKELSGQRNAVREQLAQEAETRAAKPGIPALEKARLLLVASGIRIDIVQNDGPQRSNAKKSFHELRDAVNLAPDDVVIDRAFGETMHAMNHLKPFFKTMAQAPMVGIGVRIDRDSKAAMALMLKHPEDAHCQVGVELLAKSLGDEDTQKIAAANLKKLDADEVAAARAKYAASEDDASNAKDNKT